MRILSLRLIIALILGVTLVSLASSWSEVRDEKEALRRDLQHKAETFGESVASNAELYLTNGDTAKLEQLVRRFSNRDHLMGIGIYDRGGSTLVMTREIGSLLPSAPEALTEALSQDRPETRFTRLHFRRVYLLAAPLHAADRSVIGGIVLVY